MAVIYPSTVYTAGTPDKKWHQYSVTGQKIDL